MRIHNFTRKRTYNFQIFTLTSGYQNERKDSRMKKRISIIIALGLTITIAMTGCGTTDTAASQMEAQSSEVRDSAEEKSNTGSIVWDDEVTEYAAKGSEAADKYEEEAASAAEAGSGVSSQTTAGDIFTERDLKQEADLTEARSYTVADNSDIQITEDGVYVINGTASECTILVDAPSDAKIQLVLDGVNITNSDSPAIYAASCDKVFVTTTDSVNTLTVTGAFASDDEDKKDAVIFSKDDLVLNGVGKLTVASTENGISGKDDLKITGGSYAITSSKDAIEANDSIAISGGSFVIKSSKDGLHSENDDDEAKGSIYIGGGSFEIAASGDAIQATSILEISGGTFNLSGEECLESTYVLINGGTINIEASDDGINASNKSGAYSPTVEINDGDITIVMGSGDTDAVDANGSIIINGGTINITAGSAFDYDVSGEINGGCVIVNGEQITQMTPSMMGGPGGGMEAGRGGMKGYRGQY